MSALVLLQQESLMKHIDIASMPIANVLVIVAHPDDIESWCAGTVCRFTDADRQVAYGTDNSIWISTSSEACLSRKNSRSIDVYQRMLRDFLLWLDSHPGHASFPLDRLKRSTVEMDLASLEEAGSSVSHRVRVKSVLSSYCQWLIDEHGLLSRQEVLRCEIM